MIFYLDLLNINFMVSTYTSIIFIQDKGNLYSSKLSKNISAFCTQKKNTIVFEVFIFSGFWIQKKFASLIKSVFLTSLYKTTLKSTC